MWGATCFSAFPLVATVFQSTLPVWGATSHLVCNCTILGISIHAPRVGSDPASVTCWYPAENFNPRSPCGERHSSAFHVILSANFNPRSPCGERRDHDNGQILAGRFQSTLPVWGATPVHRAAGGIRQISIHAPRVGSDLAGIKLPESLPISIHAPRVGSDGRPGRDSLG